MTESKNDTDAKVMELREPRVGVFLCHCGLNIAGTLDMDDLEEYSKTLPDVVFVKHNRYTCADPGQDEIRKAVVEQDLT